MPGQPLPFTLNVAQAGIPAGTAFTFQIDWNGNGSVVQTVSGTGGLTVSHVYSAAGSDKLKLTILDAAGEVVGQAAQPITIKPVALEMNPDPSHSGDTALAIGAPATGGTILISPSTGAVPVAVTINGKAQSIPTPSSPIGLLLVYGQGGKDVIKEVAGPGNSPVTIPAILFGGSGTNTLSAAGSSASNVLIGGTGHSTLTGGTGSDFLIGGGGPAVLQAGTGGDFLLGGSTLYDANPTALEALMAEWQRTDIGYQQRVQDLFGNGTGGLNGAYFLNTQTVARDLAVNQLIGGSTTDWFWFSDSLKSADRLSAFTNGEVATFE